MTDARRWLAVHVPRAAVVAATLAVLGNPVELALAVGGGLLVLGLCTSAAETVVGDYAGNALLGAAALAFAGRLVWVGGLLPGLAFGVVGAWLVLDGVQHLRHGVERDGRVRGLTGESSGPLRAVPRLLVGRVLEPFRLDRDR